MLPYSQIILNFIKLVRIFPQGHGRATEHKPELILNNFGTRLGRRVGRMFASLFCQDPNFKGRRAITFHNQRDFIFFRHHRYIFEEKEKTRQKEGGPKKVVQARLQVSEWSRTCLKAFTAFLARWILNIK